VTKLLVEREEDGGESNLHGTFLSQGSFLTRLRFIDAPLIPVEDRLWHLQLEEERLCIRTLQAAKTTAGGEIWNSARFSECDLRSPQPVNRDPSGNLRARGYVLGNIIEGWKCGKEKEVALGFRESWRRTTPRRCQTTPRRCQLVFRMLFIDAVPSNCDESLFLFERRRLTGTNPPANCTEGRLGKGGRFASQRNLVLQGEYLDELLGRVGKDLDAPHLVVSSLEVASGGGYLAPGGAFTAELDDLTELKGRLRFASTAEVTGAQDILNLEVQ
jgi:hypothetical protein